MKTKIKNTIMGILFAAGVLLPGSDFDGFPWINILGVCILGVVVLFAHSESSADARGGNDGLLPPS